jgi:hypothetical protein
MSANDSGPFRKSAAPPGPPPPPRFSPLRPIRAFGRWLGHFLWWSLTFSTVSWQDVQNTDAHGRVTAGSEPTGFGCLGGIVAIVAVITTVAHFSERAIDRTYHRVEMSWAAWDVLAAIVRLGRVPEAGEMEGYMVPACIERLRHNGYMDEAGAVTDAGRRALAARAAA